MYTIGIGLKGLIIHSWLARQDPYLGISMAFSTEDNAEGEKRVFAQTSSDLNPGGYRALFSLDRRPPPRLDTRGNREITPSKQCTQGLREEVQSYLAVNSIGDTDARPSRPRFFNRSLDSISRRMVVGSSRRRGNRRSFHC